LNLKSFLKCISVIPNQPSKLYKSGEIIFTPGKMFQYVTTGPCCRLYDRNELPWPSCSLRWKGKQPSWNRVGSRFVLDIATKTHPSYSVLLWGVYPKVITLYWVTLSKEQQSWWHTRLTPKIKNSLMDNGNGKP
jgi:hypothetical protein